MCGIGKCAVVVVGLCYTYNAYWPIFYIRRSLACLLGTVKPGGIIRYKHVSNPLINMPHYGAML